MFVPQHPWANKAAKLILQKLVSQVPIVGPILADIVTVVWPASICPEATSEEQFEEIREHVAALVEAKLAEKAGQPTDDTRSGCGKSDAETVVCIAESSNCNFVVETLSSPVVALANNSNLIQMMVGGNSTTTVEWTGCGSGEISEFITSTIRKEDEMVTPPLAPMLAVG